MRNIPLALLAAGVATVALLSLPVAGGILYPDGARTMHFSFNGSPNSDYPIIRPPAPYHADDGFGFVNSPDVTGNARGAQAPRYMRFDVNLPPGNYDVTVTLGNPNKAAITTVKAEAHRVMVADVHTAPRQTERKTFTVNVHKLPPNIAKDALDVPINNDGRLTLEFVGTNPSFTTLDIAPNDAAPTLYIAGDSTVSDWDDPPWSSWGSMLPQMFKPGTVAIADRAFPGRSSKSFITENRLADILSTLKKGDYLFVQFAHNDQKPAASLHTDPETTYKQELKVYIDEARKRGATPVLVTSMPRRRFSSDGHIQNSLGDYPQAMRELAAEDHVALIDLNKMATDFFDKLGPEKSQAAFLHYPAGTFPGHPEALHDDTHFSPYGGYELAKLIATGIEQAKLPLAGDLVADIPPQNLDPAKFPDSMGFAYLKTSTQASATPPPEHTP